MDRSVPDCLVTGYEGLVDQLRLPDARDRHVLAAAIRCQAVVVVTFNLADFPREVLDPYGMTAQHPDEFVADLFELSPDAVCAAVRDQRLALSRPARSVRELLDSFRSLGLAETVAALETMQDLL